MRQIFFLALLFLSAGIVRAANVSGVVTSPSSVPVSGQLVYVTDSANTFSLIALTNAAGAYSVTLPSNVAIGNEIHSSIPTCAGNVTNIAVFTGGNMTSNFTNTCASNSTYTIQGNVTLSGATNNGIADVYLIYAEYDSVQADWTLTAIDTIATTNTGAFSVTYTGYPGTLRGGLLVKAALRPNHPNYSSYLPTYYTSSLLWSSATSLPLFPLFGTQTVNINMIAGVNPGGPGFIGGSVLQGANKTSGVGDPLSSRLLLLTSMSGQPVRYTYSNASGAFSFPNLAYGSYKLFGDALGKQNPALVVTISASQPSVSNITFEENDTKFEGHIGTLSVDKLTSELGGIEVYPNPATNQVMLLGVEAIRGTKTITVCDLTGAIVSRHNLVEGQQAIIPMTALPVGFYIIRLMTENGIVDLKAIKR